jgi:hypothetical protein
MSIGPVTAFAPSTQPASIQVSAPVRPVSPAKPVESVALGPAVSLEIGAEGEPAKEGAKEPGSENRGYVRDAESNALVYQIVDQRTGDIVVQIPDEVVIKARAFAREIAASQAANQAAIPGSAIEKRA